MPGLVLGLVATTVWLGPLPDSAKLPPGSPAPAWVDLIGTDGSKHSLADLKEKPAVVLVFFSVHCPDSILYEDRLLALAQDYEGKGVSVVFLNVSRLPDDDLAHMTNHAKSKGYRVPFLFDPSQKLGLAYAARVTPTVFVLDPMRKVAYRGAFDDHYDPKGVTKRYVRDALDAVLAGRPVGTKETEAEGCDIDYEPMGDE